MITIKATPPAAERLSNQLRRGTGTVLLCRRIIVGLSMGAAGAMGIITLYQMGLLKHLPEPPLPRLDADQVDASADAYALLETPDGVLGLGNYAATIALAATGGSDRAHEHPWLPLTLAAKVLLFDAVQAARLTWKQARKQHVFCSWCLLATASTAATVPLVIPEAYTACRHLLAATGAKRKEAYHP